MTAPPVEVATRVATSVPDLPAAWVFVMSNLDRVGPFQHLEITVIHEPGPEGWTGQHLDVVLTGMVEHAADGED